MTTFSPLSPDDLERLEERLEGTGALFMEPRASFDRAIIGIAERINLSVVAYDRQQVIKVLMEDSGMDYDEACEFYEFNIAGAWLGEGTPVYIDSLRDDEAEDDEQAAEDCQQARSAESAPVPPAPPGA